MKKDLSYYLNLEYPFTIIKDIDEGKTNFVAEITDLPGCGAHGESIEEAMKSLEEAKKLWIEVSLEKGLPIPEPVSEDEFSGKFLLRIPPKFHMKLTSEARKEDLSLNQYIRKNLESETALESLFKAIKELSKKVKILSEKVNELSEKISIHPKEVTSSMWRQYYESSILAISDASGLDPDDYPCAESVKESKASDFLIKKSN